MAIKVLIVEKFAKEYAKRLLANYPNLDVSCATTAGDVITKLSGVDVLVGFGIAINNDLIAQAKKLRWIQSLATGVDHFLRMPALRADTILTSARGMHGPAMRETVAFLMLSISRDLRRLSNNQNSHTWERTRPWPALHGKTVVIAGVGVSGTAVAQLLFALGMRVIGMSRTPREIAGFSELRSIGEINSVVADADFLVNILPGDEKNRNLIGEAVFSAMKPTAFFINVGRGETVDEPALIEALRKKRIAGAALDVFAKEPLAPESPLWDMPNVLVFPHIAGFFAEYEEMASPILIENMRLFLANKMTEMNNVVPH